MENQKQTPYRKPGHYEIFATTPGERKKEPQAVVVKKDSVKTVVVRNPLTGKKDTVKTIVPVQTVTANNAAVKTPYASNIFSMRDSANYYFVINISNNTTNLASSRFGIGQFNRAHYDNSNITHQLEYVGDTTSLIYIGVFNSLGAVKAYARTIIPLMTDIMKIPKQKYSFFIITKQNLDKLADQKTLNSYLDYYQNNY